MKASSLFTGLLAGSAALSKNQVEAGIAPNVYAACARGVCTGAICSGVRQIAQGIQGAQQKVGGNALAQFPIDFGSNALATAYVDKLFAAEPGQTACHIRQLGLPVVTMSITKKRLADMPLPEPAKQAIAYGAFWAARVVQGQRAPVAAAAVSGFAFGAAAAKSLGKALNQMSKQKTATTAASVSAVSGFLAPSEQGSHPGNSGSLSYERYIRQRYGLAQDETFWTAPDGSLFLPMSSSA